MLKLLFPYEYAPSVFNINFQKLYGQGYRGLIFDIDNTLVHHGDDATPVIEAFLLRLQGMGFRILLLSDNDEVRIKRFLKNLDIPYISDANKPNTKNYNKAIKMMKLPKDKVIYIGDQIFTDIYGANKAGIPNILVKFLRFDTDKNFGKRRQVELRVLSWYRKSKYQHRLGKILVKTPGKKYYILSKDEQENSVSQGNGSSQASANASSKAKKEKKLFCEISPFTYQLSEKKGICQRYVTDFVKGKRFAKEREALELPNLVYSYSCGLIKRAPGIDPVTQENKATNIMIACSKMNGLVIHPGEEFSFWNLIGNTTRANGYKEGRVIESNQLVTGYGGGLCNLGNTIHLLVLHSPLTVSEVHYHSDALAPDSNGVRVPMSSGTSVSYNYIDFRFRNTTDQNVQLRLWVADEKLFAELRSEREFPNEYEITEENHHFAVEDGKYYRISKIYKETKDRATGEVLERDLIRDNHSEVMFDYELIPEELIY